MANCDLHNDFGLIDAYWRASNYLTIGQIYLQDNPLLREPLRAEHIKPRLLGHWGTSPGQNFVYVHLNRLIKNHDASVIYISGPGHGGPAIVAQVYLEGTYSEFYPEITQTVAGMRRLFRQFSTPALERIASRCRRRIRLCVHVFSASNPRIGTNCPSEMMKLP